MTDAVTGHSIRRPGANITVTASKDTWVSKPKWKISLKPGYGVLAMPLPW